MVRNRPRASHRIIAFVIVAAAGPLEVLGGCGDSPLSSEVQGNGGSGGDASLDSPSDASIADSASDEADHAQAVSDAGQDAGGNGGSGGDSGPDSPEDSATDTTLLDADHPDTTLLDADHPDTTPDAADGNPTPDGAAQGCVHLGGVCVTDVCPDGYAWINNVYCTQSDAASELCCADLAFCCIPQAVEHCDDLSVEHVCVDPPGACPSGFEARIGTVCQNDAGVNTQGTCCTAMVCTTAQDCGAANECCVSQKCVICTCESNADCPQNVGIDLCCMPDETCMPC